MHQTETNFPNRNRYMTGAIAVGVVGVVLSIVGAIFDLEGFFQSYLVAYLYWMGVTVGCLALMLLMNLLDGALSFSVQRLFTAGARTLPVMLILFIPVVVGITYIYPWTSAEVLAELPASKASYYTVALFIVRSLVYFGIWIGLTYLLSRWTFKNDEEQSKALLNRIQRWSVFGILILFLSGSLAAIDWNMSLDPKWYSSLYGLVYLAREGLAAIAIVVLVLGMVWQQLPLSESVRKKVLIDLGAVMLAGLMVWAYMEFFQFLIIWQGNVPFKVSWYVARSGGAWSVFIAIVVGLHFVLPLILLLMPGYRESIHRLMAVAGILLVMRLFELLWAVLPAYSSAFSFSWLNFVLPIAIGGIWVAAYLWLLRGHSLLPEYYTGWKESAASHD